MALALKVAILIVVLLVIGIAALRIRKLRRDEIRELSRPVERRLMSPPPSPYAPSKGFRLLDGPIEPARRPEPMRPRLETDRDYVFSETQMAGADEVAPSQLRHSEEWALTKSARRSASFTGLRVGAIALVIVALIGAVGLYLQHHDPKKPPVTTTTSITTTTVKRSSVTTTTLATPASFTAVSTSGQSATYHVPANKYQVVVHGTLGPSWAVYQMGPQNTLEWQGTVSQGTLESLQMTGDSLITIGSPRSATVSVDGKPVVFPSPLPPTLTLSFVTS
jgi:hypothetical protein